jgi:hypothetical protein
MTEDHDNDNDSDNDCDNERKRKERDRAVGVSLFGCERTTCTGGALIMCGTVSSGGVGSRLGGGERGKDGRGCGEGAHIPTMSAAANKAYFFLLGAAPALDRMRGRRRPRGWRRRLKRDASYSHMYEYLIQFIGGCSTLYHIS